MYMQISPVSGRWYVRLGLVGAIVGSAIASFSFANVFRSPALAQVPPDSQIVPDSTLGGENSLLNSNPNGLDTISGGARRGSNLFHSFDRFSIPNGRAALFDNGANIQNILTRVTGGSVSDINGLIQANGANLFLLNPNGIVFGQNARLNIGGSFIATTASSINFADGTQFSATPGTGAPLLTVSVPLGLQFGTNQGNIVNRASNEGLQVDTGKTLGLIGGNVNLEGGRLTARGGRIELGAVAAPGVVGINPDNSGFRFSFPTDLVLGDISLTDTALVDVRASSGGSIAVNSRNLNLAGGGIIVAGIGQDLGTPGAVAGDIDINAKGTIAIDGVGSFPDGVFRSGIFNIVDRGSTGKGGNINIGADSLSLTDGGTISTSTFGQGNTGNINITARNTANFTGVIQTGANQYAKSGIFSTVESPAKGNSGNITLTANTLLLKDGAQINANSFGDGDAGNVTVDAGDRIIIDGVGPVNPGGIASGVESPGTGSGGDINLTTGSLELKNGGIISSGNRSGEKNAGNISITARNDISIDGVGGIGFSNGVFSDVSNSGIFSATQKIGRGDGGNIDITAGSLSLTRGGTISGSNYSQGNAGQVTIIARNNISIDGVQTVETTSGVQSFTSTISSILGQISDSQTNRKGGDIDIKARSLSLNNGGYISTSTFGAGDAGNITVEIADTASFTGVNQTPDLTGVNQNIKSGVFSTVESTAKGNSGNITLTANTLLLKDGAQINANSFGDGDAGNVTVDAGDRIIIDGVGPVNPGGIASGVESPGTGSGGDINLTTGSLELKNGGIVSATNFSGEKSAGNISITARDKISIDGVISIGFSNGVFSLASNSGIFSATQKIGRGDGGNIDITTDFLSLTRGGTISSSNYSQGNAGQVTITVRNDMSIDGAQTVETANGLQSFPSAIYSILGQIPKSQNSRKGGDINITARSLSLTNGGEVNASTFGTGDAGSISITADDRFFLDGGSGVFSGVGTIGAGNGGDINIKARLLELANGSLLNVSNLSSQGDAGNIVVDVRTLKLDNGGIFAQSASGDGGNIQLQIDKRLTLRNGSEISTTAGTEQQPGNGGNITIDSPLIIAALVNEFNEDSDITANAFSGTGGDIKINTQGIFGIQPRREATPDTNDITASSELGIGGTIQLNSVEIDPSRDIVELPTGLVDASSLVAAGCPSGAENRFTVAGRGGLPPAPGDKLSPDALLTDWATLQTPETENRAAVETTTPVVTNTTHTPPVETITEATSWQYDRNGAIILTSGNTTSPDHLKATPTSCPSS